MKNKGRILTTVTVILMVSVLLGYYLLHRTERLLADAFKSKIVLLSDQSPLQIRHEGLDISILTQSFQLTNVLILPDSVITDKKRAQPHISVAAVTANDFGILPLLLHKHLTVGEILVGDLDIVYRKKENKKIEQDKIPPIKEEKKSALTKLSIGNITVDGFSIAQLNTSLLDSLAAFSGNLLSIENVILKKLDEGDELSLDTALLNISGSGIRGKSADTDLELGSFAFNTKSGQAIIEGLQWGNPDSSKVKARRQKFNTPINTISIPKLECFGIKTNSFFQHGHFRMDSILVKGAAFTILKNVEKPWNTQKNIPFPLELLRKKGKIFGIQILRITDAKTHYLEITKDQEIEIPIDSLQLTVENMVWELSKGRNEQIRPMEIHVQGRLFQDFPMELDISFHNPMQNDQFSFTGSTGSFRFESFNPVMVPTSNIKFESGHVSALSFQGTGNAEKTSGQLVMRYEDLAATVLKKKGQRKNKTLSWLANASVRKNNPKNGKLMIAKMRHQRESYKGFGNYMFKTIESGLVNSVYPFGNRKVYSK